VVRVRDVVDGNGNRRSDARPQPRRIPENGFADLGGRVEIRRISGECVNAQQVVDRRRGDDVPLDLQIRLRIDLLR